MEEEEAKFLQKLFSEEMMSKGSAVLGGAANIASTMQNLASIADTSAQRGLLQDINNFGEQKYNNYDQITSAYGSLQDMNPDLSYEAIRGASTGDKVKGVASATASGAMAGLQVGGPWGALIGGAAGLLGGVGATIAGDSKAHTEQDFLTQQNEVANNRARSGLQYNADRLSAMQGRSNMVHRAAKGGQIERKPISAKEFADVVLNRKKRNDVTRSSGIVRQHCKGGTVIRIKK